MALTSHLLEGGNGEILNKYNQWETFNDWKTSLRSNY